jgi:ABC-type transporter Mla maintaining outer membrane lipid asymmetry ATPase subunit MlaF
MSAAIELIDVRVGMEGEDRQAELNLTVGEGECLALLGPTRSGKSLVLELCAGLITPDEGIVRVLGYDLAEATDDERIELKVRVGTVLQQPGLLSNMTIFNNVALPLRYHQGDMEEEAIQAQVAAQLGPLGIGSFGDRFPSQLNQGEIRCAAIARALVLGQELLLLDDPAGGLDADMARRLAEYLADYRRAKQLTVLATMRTFSPLLESVDRVAFLREGRIEVIGPPAELMSLAEPDMRGYLRPR